MTIKIMLVDDNTIERTGIKYLLESLSLGYSISEFSNGSDALEDLKKNNYNLLITDIKMPIIDGIELIKIVRSFNREIKIIVISGYEDFSYAKSLLGYNVSDYILKPVSKEQILSTIEKVIKDDSISEKKYSATISKVLTIFQNEYSRDLRLDEVADQLFLSPSYLSATFKNEVGVSFINYLTDLRIDKAKEFLIQSNMKISSVASYVGISNSSYFNKVFKKKVGITPSEYRDLNLNK